MKHIALIPAAIMTTSVMGVVPALAADPVSGGTAELIAALQRDPRNPMLQKYIDQASATGTFSVNGYTGHVVGVEGTKNIRITIPAVGVDKTLENVSRESAPSEVTAYFDTEEGKKDISKVLKASAAERSDDPVVGNPGSLLGQMIAADFAVGTAPIGDLLDMGARVQGWHFGGGAQYMPQASRHGDTTAFGSSLGVSYVSGLGEGIEFFASAPFGIGGTDGAQSYMGSLAVGVRIPVVQNHRWKWAVSPAVRAGVSGSYDVGTAGLLVGGSATSDLRFALGGDMVLDLGNSISHYEAQSLKVDSYDFAYDVHMTAFRNGLTLARPIGKFGGRQITMAASFADTRTTGTRLAVGSWQEYGLSLVVGRAMPFRISASYISGERGYSGFQCGASFAF